MLPIKVNDMPHPGDDDALANQGRMISAKAIRKIIRQVLVSGSILVTLVPILLVVAYYDINPIWGLILTLVVIGIYLVRVLHEGQLRLAHRFESLAIQFRRISEEQRQD